ncbi:centromere protein Chl4/mis15/CENP-N [Biscogniauxia mediterranea]|nr:centromere protein Chl4/mis15/CENP-N [Biscogniauxia mediterranea]
MARVSLPTTARLPSSLRVDASNSAVIKVLNRLSRPSLLSLVLDWLDPKNLTLCPPLLRRPEEDEDDEDEDDLYPPARSLDELRSLYADLQARKGSRREIVDRILEGDWRHGLSLYQLAMADMQYLYDHPGTLKWSAYRIERLKTPRHEDDVEADGERRREEIDKESLAVPRFHPSTFLQNLQAEVLPDVKAHYNIDRPPGLPLLLLRIFVLDSPYNTDLAVSSRNQNRNRASITTTVRTSTGSLIEMSTPNNNSNNNSRRPGTATTASFDASRTIYVAFPDASPYVYISRSQSSGATTTGETKSLRGLVVEGIPKALSRPRERYALRPADLHTKNLDALLAARGPGRGAAAAGGGWGVYAAGAGEARDKALVTPLNVALPVTPPDSDAGEEGSGKKRGRGEMEKEEEERARKRRSRVAKARFGDAANMDDGRGVERVDVLLEDGFPALPNLDADALLLGGEDGEGEDMDAATTRRKRGNRAGRKTGDRDPLTPGPDEVEEEEEDGDGRNRRKAEETSWRPNLRLTFHGPHVFAGIRQLVEAGIVDGERAPGWMTGEEGVTLGAVRRGRIRGFKGSGV